MDVKFRRYFIEKGINGINRIVFLLFVLQLLKECARIYANAFNREVLKWKKIIA